MAAIIGGQVGERLRVSDAQGKPPAYLKESEFRFNHRNEDLYKILLKELRTSARRRQR